MPRNKNSIKCLFLIVLSAMLLVQNVTAQSVQKADLNITKIKLQSQILKEDRTISVYLPQNYKTGKKDYDVLYVLDGEAEVQYNQCISTIEDFYSKGIGPQMIVVSIWNTNRNRDMIPDTVSHRPGSGGSEKFLRFLHEELIPYVKQNYRISDYSVLYGASNAGLFTVYALLEKPETFDAYIASSPMIGHCPNFMQAKLEAFAQKEFFKDRALYMIYGTKDSPRVTEFVPNFQKYLESNAPKGFVSSLKILEGEGHVPKSSLSRGLQYIFSVLSHTNSW